MTWKHRLLDRLPHKQIGKILFIASTFLLISLAISLTLLYSKNNIQGTWSSPYISQTLERNINQNLSDWTHDHQANDYITEISATINISNAQGHFMVTCKIDRKALAKKLAQGSNENQNISDWYQFVDQQLAKNVTSLNGTYDPQAAQLTIPLFQTHLDPLFHNMSITKVSAPKVTKHKFKKGDSFTYKVVDNGQQLVFSSKHHEHNIIFNKD
ncbi:hypothetical protein [Streptococcus thoraltensis]|uniref:hypothetical protein n=1 Tax=Streptococcus thoraltensis TaxID=55085 RepID=UPI001F55F990|nr:hypothetical protein [Streptococcus thoraltensis]